MGTRGLLTCDIDDIFPKHEQIQKNQQITKYDNPLNKTEGRSILTFIGEDSARKIYREMIL